MLTRRLGSEVAIWADVHVKHGRSLAHASIAEEARTRFDGVWLTR